MRRSEFDRIYEEDILCCDNQICFCVSAVFGILIALGSILPFIISLGLFKNYSIFAWFVGVIVTFVAVVIPLAILRLVIKRHNVSFMLIFATIFIPIFIAYVDMYKTEQEEMDECNEKVEEDGDGWCFPFKMFIAVPGMIYSLIMFCYTGIHTCAAVHIKRVHGLHLFKDDCKCSNQPLTFVENGADDLAGLY
jgi:hypothetical protein